MEAGGEEQEAEMPNVRASEWYTPGHIVSAAVS